MGMKIHGNGFLREHHPVIDLEGSRSLCHPDVEKVRKTILEHESIFRNQLHELHRLYGRQKELMNELGRRETNVRGEMILSPSSLCPDNAKRTWHAPHSYPFHSTTGALSTLHGTGIKQYPAVHPNLHPNSCEPWFLTKGSVIPKESCDLRQASGTWNRYLASSDGNTKLSPAAVQMLQCNVDASTFDSYQRNNLVANMCLTDLKVSENLGATLNLATKNFFQNLQDGKSRNEHQSKDYPEKALLGRSSSVRDFGARNDLFPQPLPVQESVMAVSQRKSKLFGVEIDTNPLDTYRDLSTTVESKVGSSPWIAKPSVANIKLCRTNGNRGEDEKGESSTQRSFSHHFDMNMDRLPARSGTGLNLDEVPHQYTEADHGKCFMTSMSENVDHHSALTGGHNSNGNLEGGLPWFPQNSKNSSDPSKGVSSPYFMNLDSLHNCSLNFFKKTETTDENFQTPKQKKEISQPLAEDRIADELGINKHISFPISDMLDLNRSMVDSYEAGKVDVDKDNRFENKDFVLRKGLNGFISDLRLQIDLNSSLDEEVQPSAPSLPTTILKIATKEIDLEAPAAIESEMDTFIEERMLQESPKQIKSIPEECDKTAAEVLLAISLYEEKNLPDTGLPSEDTDNSCLNWFAETISLDFEAPSGFSDESIPDGVDYFEYMTLRLEHCPDEAVILKNAGDDESGKAVLAKRLQRGQSRRGRKWKDFQRDILPGIVALSRVEVSEDFQTFEGRQQLQRRNGRGRKRSMCQLEDVSLSGWGKRTRRLPRQRCPNAFLSFSVKC